MTTLENQAPIYLDYQATTPVDPRVVEAMMPYFEVCYGNPHSVEHGFGIQADEAVQASALKIAGMIGARSEDIVFTSGATEANNLAIKAFLPVRKRARLVCSAIEHPSVLETCVLLQEEGHKLEQASVNEKGIVDLDDLSRKIDEGVLLVSVMAVNSEVGTIQPVREIGQMCAEKGVLFHTDAAQAFGKIPLHVVKDSIDLMTITSHKIYGPKGIGALYINPQIHRKFRPQITGGGQQSQRRAGTVPTPLAVGFGRAAELMKSENSVEAPRLKGLREALLDGLRGELEVEVNGDLEQRIPGNLNVSISGVDAGSLVLSLRDLAISTGTACRSGSLAPSKVLLAMGHDHDRAAAAVRIGLGRMTTQSDIDRAIAALAKAVSLQYAM